MTLSFTLTEAQIDEIEEQIQKVMLSNENAKFEGEIVATWRNNKDKEIFDHEGFIRKHSRIALSFIKQVDTEALKRMQNKLFRDFVTFSPGNRVLRLYAPKFKNMREDED